MARVEKRARRQARTGANVGYEGELWKMADALRGSMDAAEYKHVVLGLIFLKYISDAFEEMHVRLEGERDQGADPEDPDEYRAQNIFWVPPEARWTSLKARAKEPKIGQLVDKAIYLRHRREAKWKKSRGGNSSHGYGCWGTRICGPSVTPTA